MASASHRLRTRRARLRNSSSARAQIASRADQDQVAALLADDGGRALARKHASEREAAYAAATDWEVTPEERAQLIAQTRQAFDAHRLDQLVADSKRAVLESIAGPFSLGRMLFHDRDGGNVTTRHNAEKGIYARPEQEAFRRSDYDNRAALMAYRDSRTVRGVVIDDYTQLPLPANCAHVDHINSVRDFHSTVGYMLSPSERRAFGSDPDNLAITSGSLNCSKGQLGAAAFAERTSVQADMPNGDLYGFDSDEDLANLELRAWGAVKRHGSTEPVPWYAIENTVGEGCKAGGRLGLQQAIGLLLAEFATSLFEEIKDVLAHGLRSRNVDQSLFQSLRERVNRISDRVLARWKDAVDAFATGALAGLLATIATAVVNVAYTTSARMVRMIREGAMSLVQAIKLLMSPPNGASRAIVMHEASKLVFGGAIVIGGIALETIIAEQPAIKAMPFGAEATAVIVGTFSGLTAIIAASLLDRIDLFGAIADQRLAAVIDEMASQFDDAYNMAEMHLAALPT